MLTQEEQSKIQSVLNRQLTDVEQCVFETMWSEHCSYKSTKRILRDLPTKGSEVALGIGEDAGIIRLTQHDGKQYCIVIAHESHNHPSQVLPVEGAATGVGGVVRDVYCMGADVIGMLNSLHFGDPKTGTHLVQEIAEKVVFGISDYANPLGVPVLGGETLYHPSYNDNCLVNVAALGVIEESKIIHSAVPLEAKKEPYDVIVIGKSTDSTGFGGARFSSETLDRDNARVNIGAVQVHDPFLKRVLVEAIKHMLKETHEKGYAIGFKDCGAGGIACATSELAAAGKFGMSVDLSRVNCCEDALPPEVIACSETQERFCLAVPRVFTNRVLEIFNSEFELPSLYPKAGAAVIGHVLDEPRYILLYKEKRVCDLPIKAITTDVEARRTAKPKKEEEIQPSVFPSIEALPSIARQILSHPNIRSKRYVYRHFDNAVRGHAVVYPGEADAVVIAPIDQCKVGVAVSMDSNLYGICSPYVSGAAAVAEGVRNVISVGAKPIAMTDCLNYGNPEDEGVFFDFQEGVRGIRDAANALGFIPNEPIPIISGNVSLYNASKKGNAVVPSPVILVLGRLEDYHRVVTMQLRNSGEKLILIGKRYPEFGGTQIKESAPFLNSEAPRVRFEEEKRQNAMIVHLIEENLISTCHDISAGGLWVTLSEMLFGERGQVISGAELTLKTEDTIWTMLFSENGGYLISVVADRYDHVKKILSGSEIFFQDIGVTLPVPQVSVYQKGSCVLQMEVSEMSALWNAYNIEE